VEEYLAYDQYRLSIKFALIMSEDESEAQFLVKVELEAENVVGSYSGAEHDACIKSLPNGSCLNRVFEMAGIAYGRRPVPKLVWRHRKKERSILTAKPLEDTLWCPLRKRLSR
jgi:hypothetical protein